MTDATQRFHLGLQKSDAWEKGRRMAEYLENLFAPKGYPGPVALAGGYMRDLALTRVPKDLDVFLDGGCFRSMDHAKEIAASLCPVLCHGAEVGQVIPCYGTWAKDIECIVKITFPKEQDQELLYLGAVPIPFSVDLVVVRRAEMAKAGYEPSVQLDSRTRFTFLASVLKRVDLRLNAIGSAADCSTCVDQWDDDALNNRLVVQYERHTDGPERIDKRVQRLLHTKFPDWSVFYEGPKGELSEESWEVE